MVKDDDFCLLSQELGEAWYQFLNDAPIERWFHETFQQSTAYSIKLIFKEKLR